MVRFTQSLVFVMCFVDHYLAFCTFSLGHCIICSSPKMARKSTQDKGKQSKNTAQ
jgi:hypothetical protein